MKNINWKSGFKRIVAVILAVAIFMAISDAYDSARFASSHDLDNLWSMFFDHLIYNLSAIGAFSLMVLTIGVVARFIYRGFTSQKV